MASHIPIMESADAKKPWSEATSIEPNDSLGVSLPHLLKTSRRSGGKMNVILGVDDSGTLIELDLLESPHLLVAGTTGSGKSSAIHAIIASLLYRHRPSELRLLLVDTKGLELPAYDAMPHILHDCVITGQDGVVVLVWAYKEVQERMRLLADTKCRNLAEYNRVTVNDSDAQTDTGEPLPVIILVIDELIDVEARHELEPSPIEMIGLNGRAVGVHLICSTQAPNALEFETPLPALFPTRLLLRFATPADSRSMFDRPYRHPPLESGEAILIAPKYPRGSRIRLAFISEDESETLVAWYAKQWELLPVPTRLQPQDFSIHDIEQRNNPDNHGDQADW